MCRRPHEEAGESIPCQLLGREVQFSYTRSILSSWIPANGKFASGKQISIWLMLMFSKVTDFP